MFFLAENKKANEKKFQQGGLHGLQYIGLVKDLWIRGRRSWIWDYDWVFIEIIVSVHNFGAP